MSEVTQERGRNCASNFPPPAEEIYEYTCGSCNSKRQFRILGPHKGGHYARINCADCGGFIKWEADPSKKKISRKGQAKLVDKFSQGYCESCLRLSDELPSPQTIEAHHIIPVEAGGGNNKDNIQIVCTPCHRLIHHQRTYLGHYGGSLSDFRQEEAA